MNNKKPEYPNENISKVHNNFYRSEMSEVYNFT